MKILQLYEKRLDGWMNAFGLTDWRYDVKFDPECPTSDGDVHYNVSARWATFKIHRKVKAKEVNSIALHEVLHIVLAEYTAQAETVFAVPFLAGKEHAIIYRIINAMGVK